VSIAQAGLAGHIRVFSCVFWIIVLKKILDEDALSFSNSYKISKKDNVFSLFVAAKNFKEVFFS
jgi:hypothetical protein